MSKVLIWSVHPGSNTGFGTVCRNLTLGLKDHFEVKVFPFEKNQMDVDIGGAIVLRNPIEGRHDLIVHYAQVEKPDAVIQVFDLWDLAKGIESYWVPNLIAYTPLDTTPVPRSLHRALSIARLVVPMCRFAEDEYLKVVADIQYWQPKLGKDAQLHQETISIAPYIYHGVDTKVFYPRDKMAARQLWGFPENAFMVVMVTANGSLRKNIPGQMRAFLRFQKEVCPTARLMIWAYPRRDDLNPLGYNLSEVWEQLGGSKDSLHLAERVPAILGIPDDYTAQLYSAADVLLECTFGEGFGLPVIESMACGTPVIATDFSSLSELVQDSGWLVSPAAGFCNNLTSSWQVLPSEEGMVEALTQVYQDKKLRQAKGARALEIASHFDWQRDIIPQWVNLISDMTEGKYGR